MKAILLAGGRGTRLHPMTLAVSKQLLPVYSQPMCYYPLRTLVRGGIKDIAVVTTPEDQLSFQRVLGSISVQLACNLTYFVQPEPGGIPQAITICEEWLGDEPFALILGDNVFETQFNFYAHHGAVIFAKDIKRTPDPTAYGNVETDADSKALTIVEKPVLKNRWKVIPGLYLFDHRAKQFARECQKSPRGILEITDIHIRYKEIGELTVRQIPTNDAWFDCGTPDTLLDASNYVRNNKEVFL